MMNRIIILLAVALMVISCNRKDKFEISGTVEGAEGEKIYLEKVVLSETEPVDSAKLRKAGTFKLKGKTETPAFYQLRINNKAVSLLIEPGEKVTFSAGASELPNTYTIDGSDGSRFVKQLNTRMNQTVHQLDSLENLYRKLVDENPDSPILDTLSVEYDDVIKKQKRHNIVFILNFYDNLASLYALYQKLDNETFLFNRTRDIQYYKILSDSLNKYHPESPQVKALRNNTKDLLANLNQQRAAKLIEGAEPTVPEIALPTPADDTVRISDLKGKPVLLSFWASWHPESITESLKLIDLYEKYHGKGFEIYQVSLDKSHDEWTRAIQFNELPWIHVSDLAYPNSYAAQLYNVQQLPTHYLINSSHDQVLGRNLSINELDRQLSAMLN